MSPQLTPFVDLEPRRDCFNPREWVEHFKAPRQSTFILCQGNKPLWFAVAEVREDVIFSRLMRTLQS